MTFPQFIIPLKNPSESDICPDCFLPRGTFKFCPETGKAHLVKRCIDCGVELTSLTRVAPKYCSVTQRPHDDARNGEFTMAELESDICPFCGYPKSQHTYCTATSWKHSEIVQKYLAHKKRVQPAKPVVTKANGVTSATPRATPPPGPTPPDAKRVKTAVIAPTPVKAPTAPRVVREAMYSDGSFLMTNVTPNMKILFVGEGNFSFSRTIGKRVFGDKPWKNLVATDLELLAGQNTPGHQFTQQNTMELLRKGAMVVTGVDAMNISKTLPFIEPGSFDLMTFQFPHNADKNFPFYPFPKGVPLESVGTHREMLAAFLREAAIMLKEGGRACITTKTSEPYKSWEVDMLAEAPMWFTKGDVFDQMKWSQVGYTHINTINKCSTSIDGAMTYIFTKDSTGCTEYPLEKAQN